MTTLLLIRHGDTDYVNEALAGRIDSPLNAAGLQQAVDLADSLKTLPIEAVYSSPLVRARQTAQPLAEWLRLPVEIEEGINQVNFGDWQGLEFEELQQDPRWQAFSRNPAAMDCPNGESAHTVRKRTRQAVFTLRERHSPTAVLALFSHGSIIRHITSTLIGLPLESLNLLTVAPASVTTIEVRSDHGKLRHLNQHLPTSWL